MKKRGIVILLFLVLIIIIININSNKNNLVYRSPDNKNLFIVKEESNFNKKTFKYYVPQFGLFKKEIRSEEIVFHNGDKFDELFKVEWIDNETPVLRYGSKEIVLNLN